METTGSHQGMGIIHSDVMDSISIVVMHGTLLNLVLKYLQFFIQNELIIVLLIVWD